MPGRLQRAASRGDSAAHMLDMRERGERAADDARLRGLESTGEKRHFFLSIS